MTTDIRELIARLRKEYSSDPEWLAVRLEAAAADHPIQLGETISTRKLTRILQYEPRDLTISVEAGVLYADLTGRLAADGLLIPLDPPWSDSVTIGGLISANLNGPRRRLYGTARDLVIGMRFVTVDGALVDTGGMVVKNVAGLDMAKLLIGSYGTLAAISSVNFKLIPLPKQSRTILFEYDSAREAFAQRDKVLKSILPVAALDMLNPPASGGSWQLALRAVSAIERYGEAFPGGRDVDCEPFWKTIQEFTPKYLSAHPNATVTRYSTTHTALPALMGSLDGPAVARAGNGVVYGYGAPLAKANYVIEHGPPGLDRWPKPGPDFALMQRVKQMLDPKGLLNKGALYGRI